MERPMLPTMRRRDDAGLTLIELLTVLIIIAVLAMICLPKFVHQSRRSKEATLQRNLSLLRKAIVCFEMDTSRFPETLDDLAATTAPENGLNGAGSLKPIKASDWRGPYVHAVPDDSVSGAAFVYLTAPPDTGKVRSSATGNGLDGTPYSGW